MNGQLELREKCLIQAIEKFNTLTDIMVAAQKFMDFLTPSATQAPPAPEIAPTPDKVADDAEKIVLPTPKIAEPTKKKGLSAVQIEIMHTIIDIQRGGVHPRQSTVAKRMNKYDAAIAPHIRVLESQGYIRLQHTTSRRFIIIPLKNADGTDFIPTETVIENGVRVTKCPPAYAMGYGIDQTIKPQNQYEV